MPSSDALKSGDLVRLRSGGPIMTLGYPSGTVWVCYWFSGMELMKGEFAIQALRLVGEDEQQ